MEEIGLCLEVAQGPQSLAMALVLGLVLASIFRALFGLTEMPHSKGLKQVGHTLTRLFPSS